MKKQGTCSRRCALIHSLGLVSAVGASSVLAGCGSSDDSEEESEEEAGDACVAGERGLRIPCVVAGVAVPDSQVAHAAAQLAYEVSSPELFNHVMRTYVFGALAMQARGVELDLELSFLGAVLHDLGLVARFSSDDVQFELDGADAARDFLEGRGVPSKRVEVVWDAVAMHTTGWLAARKRPEVAMVSLGAFTDVAGFGLDRLPAEKVASILEAFPRMAFKQSVIDTMLDHCRRKPGAVVLTQFAESGRRHLPGYNPPILEDLVLSAPFDT